MRNWTSILFILLAVAALQVRAADRLTVKQLETTLAGAHGQSDADLAARLTSALLSERFSTARLDHWLPLLPGPRSQRALTALVDRAAFLDPPPGDSPAAPAPTLAQQKQIMRQVAGYVTSAIPQLPRFYATRSITFFDGDPAPSDDPSAAATNPLRAARIARVSVQYRDGEEITNAPVLKTGASPVVDQGLRSWGVFGPILSLVLLDAAQNQLAWSHWEQDSLSSPIAVFHYSVPRGRSHYQVRYCCVLSSYGLESSTFQQMSGYHGEIAVDPSTGAILRLVLQADLQPDDPISRADVEVEYAPVALGGATFICPTRSVAVSVARTIRTTLDPSGHSYPIMGPMQILLNDVLFSQYHLFTGETRILSGAEERTAGLAPDVTLPAPDETKPSEELLADAGAAPPQPGAIAGQNRDNVPPELPEVTSERATSLPDSPVMAEQPAGSQPRGFTLQINARLVDVNVVALDKKGHPIPGLTASDFEVLDNGVQQNVRSFTQADAPVVDTTVSAQSPAQSPAQASGAFTNRPAATNAQGQTASAATVEGNTLIFLVDPSNLIWNDFIDARRQMLDFLSKLPATERVALYAQRLYRFQVLVEASTDHQAVAQRLLTWMPTAQDLLNARNEEDRNRQHFESVHNLEDMLSVNGNFTLDPETQGEAQDPKLRELGDNPGGTSLDLLVSVAGHLKPMPGHKSLIWVTSDNALADWNRMSVSIDKHAKYVAPAALKAQEALNNAHTTIYPLDASRLEGSVVTADLGNRNVQLSPTYQNPNGAPPQVAAVEAQALGPEASAGSSPVDPMNPFQTNRDWGTNGRLFSQMQQDMHPIEGVFREVAEATGGRTFRRSSNLIGEFGDVVAESHATYLIGFTPSTPADNQYHRLTVKLVNHPGATIRYRTGYNYTKEPTSLKDRFARAVWDPTDASEIGITARAVTDSQGQAIRVTINGVDLELTAQTAQPKPAAANPASVQPASIQQPADQPSQFWAGKLDIFLVQRNEVAQSARVTGQTVGLRLKPGTYRHAISEGLTFDERLPAKAGLSSYRIVVVDVNSGRIGSVTIPSTALGAASESKSTEGSPKPPTS